MKEGICFLYICIDHVHVYVLPSVGSYPEYTDEELLQINKKRADTLIHKWEKDLNST